jgi:hypothetical protein|nr:MAG TPA: hypothetical protein [Caudoviricetes sp.]
MPEDKYKSPDDNKSSDVSSIIKQDSKLDRENITNSMSSDDEFQRFLRSNGIYKRNDMSLFDCFHRYPRLDPYNAMPPAREYVFFTKPDLNLYQAKGVLNPQIANMQMFKDLDRRGYRNVLEQLQYSMNPNRPFMNLLSNRRTSNIDLPSIVADVLESNANMYNTKIHYRKGTEPADENVEFSVEFEDTKFLEVYTLFKIYDEYQKRKWYGVLTPPTLGDDPRESDQIPDYIAYKILHDKMGMFRFLVSEDGMTILHWAQFWGVMPLSVPREALSDIPQDGHLKFTVNFKADFVEDMEPNTLSDFNNISSSIPCSNPDIPVFDTVRRQVDGENVKRPWVEGVDSQLSADVNKTAGNYKMYRLKWGGDA